MSMAMYFGQPEIRITSANTICPMAGAAASTYVENIGDAEIRIYVVELKTKLNVFFDCPGQRTAAAFDTSPFP